MISFFTDDSGNVSKCSSYKKEIEAVLRAGAGAGVLSTETGVIGTGAEWREKECRTLIAYLPRIRPRRKNIQFLTIDEVEVIRSLLDGENSGLSLRDRAIGKLLFFTGLRACDIAGMTLASIDWETDEIRVSQQKTSQPPTLPLTAAIGNSIYDYLENERPESSDTHLFLSEVYPHYPFKAGAVWHQAAKIYKAASLRQEKGDRRGTHLFRYNVATSFLGSGVPRPVISQTLGHTDPGSLEPYLHADLVHLKECALNGLAPAPASPLLPSPFAGRRQQPVAYDIRHHYAITNINNWTDDGFAFNDKLQYLSKSMGHRSIEATRYYYSIVPRLADTLIEKTEAGFNAIVPEVLERLRIEKWILWLKESRGCSSDTCNVRLASIRVFLKYAGSRDVGLLYLYQEAKSIKRLKCVKKKVSGLTHDAVAAMLAVPDVATAIMRRDLVFMILLYATAARLDEILSIKLKQIHVEPAKNPYVTIIGKGQKIRTLYLLPKAVAHIKKYMGEAHVSQADPDAYLFYSRVGGKYAKLTAPAIDKRLKKYAEKAHGKNPDVPLKLHAHQFRHAKASHWIEDGLNVLQVSFLLGHAQLETTMVYLDITTEDKAKAMATLESENDKTISKRWKNPNGSLCGFCGLK